MLTQLLDLPESRFHSDHDLRWDTLANWRAALVRQLLTPAPDIAAVNWKRATFFSDQHRFGDVQPERIEQAIRADLAFLAAHPTRRAAKKPS
jgi:hypothetical protein